MRNSTKINLSDFEANVIYTKIQSAASLCIFNLKIQSGIPGDRLTLRAIFIIARTIICMLEFFQVIFFHAKEKRS